MQKFSDILNTLATVDHVSQIRLIDSSGHQVAVIENKPGSAGSVRVYHHLLQKWGSLTPQAAQDGLTIYAEHTQDAELNPGKHPNIDRLFAIIAQQTTLQIQVLNS
jgi:hypothetical protein